MKSFNRIYELIIPIFFWAFFIFSAFWWFSGQPVVWHSPQIPPEVPKARALNAVNNWAFATSSLAYWSGTSTPSSVPSACGSSNTTPTAMVSASSTKGMFKAMGGTSASTVYSTMLTQAYTTPGSAGTNILVKGQFAWSALGGTFNTTASTTYVELDVYDSSNSTLIASLGCQGNIVNVAAATSTFSANTYLNANTAYTIRVTLTTKQKNGSSQKAVTVAVDNIDINDAPIGLSSSAPNASTTVSLAWTASGAALDQVPGLKGSTPYKVYRSTSATINTTTDFLSNGTTNSYTDSNGQPNTTYYYAVSDVDTQNVESPVSATSTILTNPGVPSSTSTPYFSGIGSTGLTVNWNAPTNGASNYNIWRCTGGNCGGTSSNFSPLATTSITSFGDTGLASGTAYDYEIRALNANNSYGNFSSYGQATTTSVSLTFTIDTSSVSFVSTLTPGTPISTSSVLTINTNNSSGYNIQINRASTTPTLILSADNATTIADTPNGNNWTSPGTSATTTAGPSVAWTAGATQGLGFRVKQTGTDSGAYQAAWWGTDDTSPNALYSGISTSTAAQVICWKNIGTASNENITVGYQLDTAANQKSGKYVSSPVVYTATVNP